MGVVDIIFISICAITIIVTSAMLISRKIKKKKNSKGF